MTHISHQAILRRVWGAESGTRHFEFEMANGQRLEFRAGQFISLYLGRNGCRIARPYSIAARRTGGRFELCVSLTPADPEAGSWFRSARPGDEIEFSGPFGAFKLSETPSPVSAFIGTGTGIAPLRAMLQELYRFHSPEEVWLIFGARRESDILYREEFEQLAREHSSFHFIPTLSRPGPDWKGHRGYVQDAIAKYLARKPGLHTYVCGSPEMVEGVGALLRSLGYPPEAISVERFE